MPNLLESLNPIQQQAVKATEGPCLILAGAGSGKCVTGDTMIFTDKGIIRIDQIPNYYPDEDNNQFRAGVISYSLNGSYSTRSTSHWFKFKKNKTVKIITKSGYQLTGTPEHPILILNHNGNLCYKKLSELQIDDVVAISKKNDLWGNSELDSDIAYFIGLLIGDGYLGRRDGIGFAQVEKPVIEAFKRIAKGKFGVDPSRIKSRYRYPESDKRRSITHYIYNIGLKKRLEMFGLKMVGPLDKSIPQSVLLAPKKSVKAFLQGVFDTEGSAAGATVELNTGSETLARQIHTCLLNFGIRSSLKPKYVKAYKNHIYWRLAITGSSLRTFAKEIGFKSHHSKSTKLQVIVSKISNSNIEVIPFQKENFIYIKDTYLLGRGFYDSTNYYIFPDSPQRLYLRDYLRARTNPSPQQFKRIIETVYQGGDNRIDNMLNLSANFFFDGIGDIKVNNKKVPVYDFTVPYTHSFVGNGFINHNTRVLTHRVAYLIKEKGVPAENILTLTFTNKAAKEMMDRINHLLESNPQKPVMGTFHSLCARILRRDGKHIGLSPAFSIYDENDALDTVKEAMAKLDISPKKAAPSAVRHTISSAKNEMISSFEYPQYARGPFQETVAKIYLEYQRILEKNQAVDFDDLLLLTVKLFQNHPEVLSSYQIRFRYILIDEYQDTNPAQYILSKMLANRYKNICVVGDASQSIYGFRGADFRNIVNFKVDYTNASVFNLEQNYRSTQIILDAAHAVIAKNKSHPILKLWTNNPKGQKIQVAQIDNETEEALFIVNTIRQLNLALSDAAVLYRTNAQSRALEEVLLKTGVPYILVGGIRFYERKEIKDVLSYLRLLSNPKDSVSSSRIDKIGKTRAAKFWDLLVEIEPHLNDYTTLELLDLILQRTGYLELIDGEDPLEKSRVENVKELRSVAEQFPNLLEFLQNLALVESEYSSDEKQKKGDSKEAITLMTLHQAKGLEWPYVFMVGMEEGLFPHSRSLLDPSEMEEERRLCYVGITRAKHLLFLTYTRQRLYFGSRTHNLVSRFLMDLPESLLQNSLPSRNEGDVDNIVNKDDDWLNF